MLSVHHKVFIKTKQKSSIVYHQQTLLLRYHHADFHRLFFSIMNSRTQGFSYQFLLRYPRLIVSSDTRYTNVEFKWVQKICFMISPFCAYIRVIIIFLNNILTPPKENNHVYISKEWVFHIGISRDQIMLENHNL